MTEVFKCRKPGTKCCAPKTLIKETINQKDDPHKESNTLSSLSISHTTVSPISTQQSKFPNNIN